MRRKGVKQGELAEALGIAQSAVSNYLKGKNPNTAILLKIGAYFDRNPVEIFNRSLEDIDDPRGGKPAFGIIPETLMESLEDKELDTAIKHFRQHLEDAKQP